MNLTLSMISLMMGLEISVVLLNRPSKPLYCTRTFLSSTNGGLRKVTLTEPPSLGRCISTCLGLRLAGLFLEEKVLGGCLEGAARRTGYFVPPFGRSSPQKKQTLVFSRLSLLHFGQSMRNILTIII